MNNDFEELEKRLNKIIENQKTAKAQRTVIIVLLIALVVMKYVLD